MAFEGTEPSIGLVRPLSTDFELPPGLKAGFRSVARDSLGSAAVNSLSVSGYDGELAFTVIDPAEFIRFRVTIGWGPHPDDGEVDELADLILENITEEDDEPVEGTAFPLTIDKKSGRVLLGSGIGAGVRNRMQLLISKALWL